MREEGKGVRRVHFGSSGGSRPPEAARGSEVRAAAICDAYSSGTVPRHHLFITALLSGELLAGVRGLLAEVWLKPGGSAFPMPMSPRGHTGGRIPELLGQASGRTQASGHRDPPEEDAHVTVLWQLDACPLGPKSASLNSLTVAH